MSPKALVHEIVDGMPDDASLSEIVDQIRLEVSLEHAELDIGDGRITPHDELKARALERRKRYK